MAEEPQIGLRIEDEFLKCIDGWRRKQKDLPTRSEAVRRLLEIALRDERAEAIVQNVARQSRERKARLEAAKGNSAPRSASVGRPTARTGSFSVLAQRPLSDEVEG